MTKTILLILLAVVVVGSIGYFAWYSRTSAPTVPPVASSTSPTPTTPSSTPTSTPSTSAYLQPTSGPVGTVVTIYGSFSDSGNTILMNGLVGPGFKDISSPDGNTLTFTVPGTLGPNCAPDQACPQFLMKVTSAPYKISVLTNGMTEDIEIFTVVGGPALTP